MFNYNKLLQGMSQDKKLFTSKNTQRITQVLS